MRTTITSEGRRERYVNHWLSEGETWATYGMDQPNPFFAHVESFMPFCGYCSRTIKGVAREDPEVRRRVEA